MCVGRQEAAGALSQAHACLCLSAEHVCLNELCVPRTEFVCTSAGGEPRCYSVFSDIRGRCPAFSVHPVRLLPRQSAARVFCSAGVTDAVRPVTLSARLKVFHVLLNAVCLSLSILTWKGCSFQTSF